MQAAVCTSSSSSIRATGMPDCMMAITDSTASARLTNWQVADEIASGIGCSRSWISVMTPNVPSDPTNSPVRS